MKFISIYSMSNNDLSIFMAIVYLSYISLLKNYSPLLLFHLLDSLLYLGFEEAERGCCGTGNIEVSILCNRFSINTCSNSSSYLFWDSYHPTEKAYFVLSSLVLDNKIKDFF